MNEAAPGRRSKIPFAWLWRWWCREWRRTAVILLVLLAALLVVRGVANVWVGHQLNDELSRLEKMYGRLDVASLAPPHVPPGENRARVMRAAANLLVVDAATLSRFMAPAAPTTEDLQRLIDENRLALQVAEQGRRRPKSNWQIDYANDANLPPLMELRNLSHLLAMSCRLDIDAGRADEAGEAALAGLAEVASLGQEPYLIIQLIRFAVASEQLACVRDLLQRGEPSPTLLSDLAAALAENRTPDASHTALLGELKVVNYRFAQLEGGAAVDFGGGFSPGPALAWIGRPWIRYLRLRLLRTVAGIAESESVPPFARRAPEPTKPTRWWEFARRFDQMRTAGLERTAQAGYECLSELNAAQLAVALRRYRLDRGTYPAVLGDLAPEYLANVPIDPFTGRPPEYVRQGAGFELRVHGAPGIASRLLEWTIAQ